MFNWKELSPEEERKLIIESLLKAGVDVCVNGEEGITNPDVILENGKTIPLSEYNLFENFWFDYTDISITSYETEYEKYFFDLSINNMIEKYVYKADDKSNDFIITNNKVAIAA